MLKKFVTEWNEALNSRVVTSRFNTDNGGTRQQCVFSFRDTEIVTTEVWTKDKTLSNIVLFVPTTGKFINPKHATIENNLHWMTVAGILKSITIGNQNEEKWKLRRSLWLDRQVKRSSEEAAKKLKATECYSDVEIDLFLAIIKHHVQSDNIVRASIITNVLVNFAADIVGKDIRFFGGPSKYIDKMYGMFASIVNKRYVRNNLYTINIKDCKYLFQREINSANIPPVYKRIRGVTSEMYDACGNSTNFIYLADALCAYYSTVTCVPYEIKLAEIQVREQSVKERKQRQVDVISGSNTLGKLGQIGDVPSSDVLGKLNLR